MPPELERSVVTEDTVMKMKQVWAIIRIAQHAEPGELETIKVGLDKAFGHAWRDFDWKKALKDPNQLALGF